MTRFVFVIGCYGIAKDLATFVNNNIGTWPILKLTSIFRNTFSRDLAGFETRLFCRFVALQMTIPLMYISLFSKKMDLAMFETRRLI